MISIIPFSENNKEYIKALNYEWLQKYFYVEPTDVEQLSDPQFHIVDKGGHIYFAGYNGKIVGTASLIKVNDTIYELAKMAVTEAYRGLGIGKILLEYCLKKAPELGASKLILYSNTKLKAAIHLYKQHCFKEVELPAHVHYARADIMIEFLL
ncbi:MAG: GNAT family N-acetyltransferase [Ferruginibacter sp.]